MSLLFHSISYALIAYTVHVHVCFSMQGNRIGSVGTLWKPISRYEFVRVALWKLIGLSAQFIFNFLLFWRHEIKCPKLYKWWKQPFLIFVFTCIVSGNRGGVIYVPSLGVVLFFQAVKQLWDSNHDSSVAMTQLFMCAKNQFNWLNNFGNMRPNPKGNLHIFVELFIL